MQSIQDLNGKILEITMFIHEKHPELSQYLNEMLATIPVEQNPKMDVEHLQHYYNSLQELLKKYELEHPESKKHL